MRKELKNIAEYKKRSNDAFASVARSFGEANNRFQALAVESLGRAVRISLSTCTYISEISKLGRMFFVGTEPHSSATITAMCYLNQKSRG